MSADAYVQQPSGLIVPKSARKPIALDLFAGAGGMSLGFTQAGFDVIAALEWDEWASLTYIFNLGAYPIQMVYSSPEDRKRFEKAVEKFMDGTDAGFAEMNGVRQLRNPRNDPSDHACRYFFFGDVRKFDGAKMLEIMGLERGEVDCIMGGPPCPGFSMAGKRDVMDPRNSLVFEFARLVCEIKPQTMVFENVPGILSMVTPEGIPVVDAFCRILERGDYAPYEAMRKALMGKETARVVQSRGRISAEPEESEQLALAVAL